MDNEHNCETAMKAFFAKHIDNMPSDAKPTGINLLLVQWAFRIGYVNGANSIIKDIKTKLLSQHAPPTIY